MWKVKLQPAQSKKDIWDIWADVNTSTPIALTNTNSATHQNSKNLSEKKCRIVSQKPRIPQTFIRPNTSARTPVHFWIIRAPYRTLSTRMRRHNKHLNYLFIYLLNYFFASNFYYAFSASNLNLFFNRKCASRTNGYTNKKWSV